MWEKGREGKTVDLYQEKFPWWKWLKFSGQAGTEGYFALSMGSGGLQLNTW